MEDIWIHRGGPDVKGNEPFDRSGRALLWFTSHWYELRKPYRFSLPRRLVEWLNAPDLDFTTTVQHRPGLYGTVPANGLKRISRFMRSRWEQRGRVPTLADMEGYFDFLAAFAFVDLPSRNAPAALLPEEVLAWLNLPAAEEDLPLTVGMLLHIKRTYPQEYQHLVGATREHLLALSFRAAQDLVSLVDPRFIPGWVSRFWSRRPLPLGIATVFEYVSARTSGQECVNDAALDEKAMRRCFHRDSEQADRTRLLFSGPPSDACGDSAKVQLIERAILLYRDHVTVAGLSRAGASISSALKRSSLPVFDLHFSLGRERLETEAERNRKAWANARRKLHILNLNPENVAECLYANLGRIGAHDYLIGQFAWEFSNTAQVHKPGLDMVDEVWTGSRFLKQLYETEINKPVITMGQFVSTRQCPALEPEQFGFTRDTRLFLCSFDAGSIIERKNPLGVITAFQAAFPRGTECVGLIFKTRNLEHIQTERDRVHWAAALERIAQDYRIRVLEQTMTEDELVGLHRMCDCFVSLHRSEGFGFGPAEAMGQGKPVIATNYSGVCDFCTPETARLVDYELIPVKRNEYPFLDPDRTYEWADPDLNMAAESMRMLAEDRKECERLGRAGRELIRREYSIEVLRNRYLTRLDQLGFGENCRTIQAHAH